ncbi:MAG: hypothetical protein ABJ314_10975 [Ilumatobacter sp.]
MALAGLAAAVFSIAFAALVPAQLALMSILDAGRAERAASQISESRFTGDLVEQTVVRAIAPVAGEGLARQAATVASDDPSVRDVVERSLLDAHAQIVDSDPPVEVVDADTAVGTAIVSSILDTAAANGVDVAALGVGDSQSLDPTAIAVDAGLPTVVPDDLPRLGLRSAAETTRLVALVVTLLAALLAVLVHPRSGRALRGIGIKAAIVAGAWLVTLLAVGWLIGLVSDTLFGEMIEAVWSDAVPSMLLLVGGGALIGLALAFAGIALDGFTRTVGPSNSPRRPPRRH